MISVKTLKLQPISIYRTELMGGAILLIMLYHTKADFSRSFILSFLKMIHDIGYCGVDIFFFLSGFGLVSGWLNKKYVLFEFYKRRLLRVVPTYWTWMLLNGFLSIIVFKNFKIRGFVADFFGIGFLSSKSYNNWFVPAIILCYIAFPITISFLLRKGERYWANKNLFLMIAFASLPSIGILPILVFLNKYQLLIFAVRLPNFILGILIGLAYFKRRDHTLKNLNISSSLFVLLIILGLIPLYLTLAFNTMVFNYRYGLLWYPFILLGFPLCLVLTNGMSWLENSFPETNIVVTIKRFLRFCGTYSLEIYLVHSSLFTLSLSLHNFLDSFELSSVLDERQFFSYILLIIGSIGIAYLLSQLVRRFSNLVLSNSWRSSN